MQRDADEIFRVKDLSMLKSPVPSHIANKKAGSPGISLGSGQVSSPGTPSAAFAIHHKPGSSPAFPLMRPTPKPMGPPPIRPGLTPLSSMPRTGATGTPGTVSKNLFPLPSATRTAAEPATPLAKRIGDSGLVSKSLSLELEPAVDPVVQIDPVDPFVEPVEPLRQKTEEECTRELTDSIFKDIVDESKLEDETTATFEEAENAAPELEAQVVAEPEQKPMEVKPKRPRGRPPKAKTIDDAVKAELEAEMSSSASVEPKKADEVKKVVSPAKKETPAVETAKETKKVEPSPQVKRGAKKDVAKKEEPVSEKEPASKATEKEKDTPVANDNGKAVAPINKTVDQEAASGDKMPIAVPLTSSKEYTLDNWYLQRIPNNPKFSQVHRTLTEDWVVLVGIKEDTGELWHSSIVSGREDAKRILTGSGRLYNLKQADVPSFVGTGFSRKLVDRFASKGFPEDWQEALLQEIGHPIKPSPAVPKTLVAKTPKSAPKPVVKAPKTTSPKASPKTASPKLSEASLVVVKAKRGRPKKTEAAVVTPAKVIVTPKRPATEQRKRLSPVNTNTEESTPRVLGSTRSGRKIITPIPFWDSKAAAAAIHSSALKASPSTLRLKRKWGNDIQLA